MLEVILLRAQFTRVTQINSDHVNFLLWLSHAVVATPASHPWTSQTIGKLTRKHPKLLCSLRCRPIPPFPLEETFPALGFRAMSASTSRGVFLSHGERAETTLCGFVWAFTTSGVKSTSCVQHYESHSNINLVFPLWHVPSLQFPPLSFILRNSSLFKGALNLFLERDRV